MPRGERKRARAAGSDQRTHVSKSSGRKVKVEDRDETKRANEPKPPLAGKCVPATSTLKQIGGGSNGTIFLVTDVDDAEHPYVLKIQAPGDGADRDASYLNALRAAAVRRAFPNDPSPIVPQITEAYTCKWGDGKERAVIRMQPLIGNALEIAKNFDRIMPAEYVAALFSIVDKLDAAGIVHGDLKLDQFLFWSGGPWLLTDFGFAGHWGDPLNLLETKDRFLEPDLGWLRDERFGCGRSGIDAITRAEWRFINRWQLEMNLVGENIKVQYPDGSTEMFERSIPPSADDEIAYRIFVERMAADVCGPSTEERIQKWYVSRVKPKWFDVPTRIDTFPPVLAASLQKFRDGVRWTIQENSRVETIKSSVVNARAQKDLFYTTALQRSATDGGAAIVPAIIDAFECRWQQERATRLVVRMLEYDDDMFEGFRSDKIIPWRMIDRMFEVVSVLDRHGIVHGDVRLQNFWVRGEQLVLANFESAGHWADPLDKLKQTASELVVPKTSRPGVGWTKTLLCPTTLKLKYWPFMNRWQLELSLVVDGFKEISRDGEVSLFARSHPKKDIDAAYRAFIKRMHVDRNSVCFNDEVYEWAKRRIVQES